MSSRDFETNVSKQGSQIGLWVRVPTRQRGSSSHGPNVKAFNDCDIKNNMLKSGATPSIEGGVGLCVIIVDHKYHNLHTCLQNTKNMPWMLLLPTVSVQATSVDTY